MLRYLTTLRSTLGKQTATFFSAQAANAGLGLLIAFVLTGALDPGEYGMYQTLVSVFLITMTFFDLGLNPAVKRLIATSEDNRDAELYGAAVLASLTLGLLLVIVLAVLSLFLESFFAKSPGSGDILLFMAPFALLYPLYELVVSVSQGRNNIAVLSAAYVLPKTLFFVVILIIGAVTGYDATTALVLFLVTFGATGVLMTVVLKPSFKNQKQSFRDIIKEIKEFGFNLYYGRVIDGVTNGFDKILITRYYGNIPTGVYGLGMALVLPVSMFSRAVSASAYKRFTVEKSISRKTTLFAVGGCIVSGIVIVLGWMYLVPMFFSKNYGDALDILPYMAVGSALAGMNALYHTFLAAKRQGKDLRTMSFVTSGLNIVLNLVLVPLYSMFGAAIAYIATYGVNLVMNLYYYRRYLAAAASEESHV